MHQLSRTLTLILGVALLLAALPAAAPAAPACDLDEKSRLGLMPPACGPAPGEYLTAPTAEATMFGDPLEAQVPSWPQVLAAANLDGDPGVELPLLTDEYFAPTTDRALLVYGLEGGALAQSQQIAGGAAPAAIAAGALADGPALAAALAGDNAIAVYTGTLPMHGPIALPQPGAPDAVAFADLTGDLIPEIVAISPETERIVARDGDQPGFPIVRTIPFATDGFSALRVGDMDNDGYDDLVALRGAGYATESVLILFQEDGRFARSLALSPATGGFLPHSLAVGDLNGDGRDDLAVVAGGNAPNAFLSLFLQTDAGFSALPPIATFHIPGAVALADVTHDGRLDALVFHHAWRTLSVFVQQADGSLAAPTTKLLPYSGARRPDSMVVADVSGDGGLDLALVSRVPGLTLLSNTQGAPVATISAPELAQIVPAGPLTVRGAVGLDAARVEVRVKGISGWAVANLTGGTWQIDVSLPDVARPYTIEARAISTSGRVQAPYAYVRVQVGPLLVGYALADNGESPGSSDRLVRFDPETGAATLIGPTGTDLIHAITFLPGVNTLVAADRDRLGVIDLATGVFTLRPQPFGKGRNGSNEIIFGNAHGLAPDPATGKLFAVMRLGRAGQADLLFMLDPTSGVHVADAFGPRKDFVRIRGSGVGTDIDDLAYDPASGTLYALANTNGRNDQLVTIDPASGAATLIGSLGVDNMEGLTLAPDGVLYGSSGAHPEPTNDRLWTIDRMTGAATLVGPFGIESDYEGLAFLPPGASRPRETDAPRLASFTLDNGAHTTARRTVTVRGASAGATTVERVRLVEYRYDPVSGGWTPTAAEARLNTEDVPYAELVAGLEWELSPGPGARYLLAWAVDAAGVATPLAEQGVINLIPATLSLPAGGGQIFRYNLNAGDQLDLGLESLRGDADLVVWASDAGEPVRLSNLAMGADRIAFTAPLDGLYQVEVRATQASQARLSMILNRAGTAPPLPEFSAGVDPAKPKPAVPIIALDSLPSRRLPQEAEQRIYLPQIER